MNVAKRLVIFCFIFTQLTAAEHKLVASDPAASDYFGSSVAVSGDYAIIGAYYDDDAGSNSGAAYIFNRVPGTGNWIQTDKLIASDAAASNQFGYSVDMHGDYAIVGAYGNSHPSYGMGAAYIFQKDADSEEWLQRAKLVANDPYLGDSFGISVAIDLNYALVGATGDDDVISESGSAYVFKRDEGLQSWSLMDKLTESNASQGANFGSSVELQAEYAILSSHRGTTESALIFKRDTGAETWSEQAVLIASDWSAGDEFGVSVSISEDYAVVGSRYDDYDSHSNAGSAYIFKRDSGLETWTEMTKLTPSDIGSGISFFGSAVAILNRQIIVGAYPTGSGKAYLFDRASGEETWTESVILPQNTIDGGQHFGESVDLSGSFLLCGAPYDDESYMNSGSAYLIDQSDFSLAVELSGFSAHSKNGMIEVNWTTSSEMENLGFTLERKFSGHLEHSGELSAGSAERWLEIASFKTHPALSGQGSSTRETAYSFSDMPLQTGMWHYRLSDVDYQGRATLHSPISVALVAANQAPGQARIQVNSIFPNPFNPGTTISYTLDGANTISVAILDLRGRTLRTLSDDQELASGFYTSYWDGCDTGGRRLSTGVFLVRISTGTHHWIRKIIMLD